MTAKTSAERKREERERNRQAGFKLIQKWVHPDDAHKALRYIRRLNRRRGFHA